MQGTTTYILNGIALVVVQLVIRVLNWPIVILIYAAQHHNWDVIKAVYSLNPMCTIATTLWQALEVYWFWMVMQLAAGITKKKNK